MARLTLPEGGLQVLQAPVAGLISASSAVIGSIAGAKGEALFSIIARSEVDLVGMVPVRDITKLAIGQTARIKIIGTGEVDGRVRRIASTIEPDSQLGQVFVGAGLPRRLLVNSSARALIRTGQSCGIAVPLTAILYGSADRGAVVRSARVETRLVEVGLMSGGQVEIKKGHRGRRHRGGPRRRAAARRRPGAAGDGFGVGGEEVASLPRHLVQAQGPITTGGCGDGKIVEQPCLNRAAAAYGPLRCRGDGRGRLWSAEQAAAFRACITFTSSRSRWHGTLYIGATRSLRKRMEEHRGR